MVEKKVQTKFLTWLKNKGYYYVKTIVTSKSGTPDCLVCVNGYFVAIEFKSSRGKLSPLQKITSDKIRMNGGWFFKVDPSNIEQTQNIIQHLEEVG